MFAFRPKYVSFCYYFLIIKQTFITCILLCRTFLFASILILKECFIQIAKEIKKMKDTTIRYFVYILQV